MPEEPFYTPLDGMLLLGLTLFEEQLSTLHVRSLPIDAVETFPLLAATLLVLLLVVVVFLTSVFLELDCATPFSLPVFAVKFLL